jgi:hypothetical protein
MIDATSGSALKPIARARGVRKFTGQVFTIAWMRAYEALGLKDLRADAERVMRRNFPGSPYFKGPLKRDVAWWRIWDPDW